MAFLPADTYTVSQLGDELRDILAGAFYSIWVVGEVQRLRMRGGHAYFELVEKGEDDRIVGRLDIALFRRDLSRARGVLRRAGQELAEHQTLRCRGEIDFYPPSGRLQFVARDVDPLYGLGLLEQRRRETLEQLRASGLLERNGRLPLSPVPLRIGLVTAPGSAAYHDFLATLRQSGYGFEVAVAAVAVQGAHAGRDIGLALASLERRFRSLDCVVIARGGGARADLAVFDGRALAEAIAQFPVPVLTGIGHEIDESIADRVAHSAFKTPTGVAEFLCQRVSESDRQLGTVETSLARVAGARLVRARERYDRVGRALKLCRLPVSAVEERLRSLSLGLRQAASSMARHGLRRVEGLRVRLQSFAPRQLVDAGSRLTHLESRLHGRSEARLERTRRQLDQLERLVHELSPKRVLERGYSITRDDQGKTVRGSDELVAGGRVETQLFRGHFWSRVESVDQGRRESAAVESVPARHSKAR